MAYRGTGRDPYWLSARFDSRCACGQHDIKAGEKIFYYPNGKKAYGGACAEKASADFSACAADERSYGGGY